ncbi:MAG: helix-turn-helix domain-containing protein [Microscillaceae bacterium]|jgi:transcriptional regulator with XRE-family HTH domain|nr:helix-turn-helix domain-containing protein [Microscillaceae bacterium]
MEIHERIKLIRERKGLKQSDVADKIGIERPNFTHWEKRGKRLTFEQLEQIAEALEVSIKEILFGEQPKGNEWEMEKLTRENELLKKELDTYKTLFEIADKKLNEYKTAEKVSDWTNEFAKMFLRYTDLEQLYKAYEKELVMVAKEPKIDKDLRAWKVIALANAYNQVKEWIETTQNIQNLK